MARRPAAFANNTKTEAVPSLQKQIEQTLYASVGLAGHAPNRSKHPIRALYHISGTELRYASNLKHYGVLLQRCESASQSIANHWQRSALGSDQH